MRSSRRGGSGAAWTSYVFVQNLGLDPNQFRHVIPCPFHPDSEPSFSVDLAKAVFFCHGQCREPKGGGAIEFLIKWRAAKDNRKITREDARRELRSLFRVVDSKTLSLQFAREEVGFFARHMSAFYADACKGTQRLIDKINTRAKGTPFPDGAWEWHALGALYRLLGWYEFAFSICTASGKSPRPEIFDLIKHAKKEGLWAGVQEIVLGYMSRKNVRRKRHLENERELCQEHPSHLPGTTETPPQRQPVLPRTPVKK